MAISVNNNTVQITLLPHDRNFVDLIQNRITAYGQIPYSVPEKLIVEIIRESARYFYRMGYNKSQAKMFYRVPLAEIQRFKSGNQDSDINDSMLMMCTDDDFVSTNIGDNAGSFQGYVVPLPSFVSNVYEIYEANESSREIDEFDTKTSMENANSTQNIRGINKSLYMLERVCSMVETQNFQSILKSGIPFNYQLATHKLLIHKVVEDTLVLECGCNVDIQHLYNDDLFIRHTIGRTKQELSRIIGGHVIELPGGTTLNVEAICNNLEDVEKVEDIIKASSGVGDIIMCRD